MKIDVFWFKFDRNWYLSVKKGLRHLGGDDNFTCFLIQYPIDQHNQTFKKHI